MGGLAWICPVGEGFAGLGVWLLPCLCIGSNEGNKPTRKTERRQEASGICCVKMAGLPLPSRLQLAAALALLQHGEGRWAPEVLILLQRRSEPSRQRNCSLPVMDRVDLGILFFH